MKPRSVLRAVAAVAGAPSLGAAASSGGKGTVYTRLGVTPLINAMGTVTILGGSLMPPEVVRAMEEASRLVGKVKGVAVETHVTRDR